MSWRCIFLFPLLCFFAPIIFAQVPQSDSFESELFSLEFLLQHCDQIRLTSTQVDQLRLEVRETDVKIQQLHLQLDSSRRALIKGLNVEDLDTDQAVGKVDEVLSLEKKLKKLQLQTLIKLRSHLQPEQVKVARTIQHQKIRSHHTQQKLRGKVDRIQRLAAAQSTSGNAPRQVMKMMERLPPLLQQGKVGQANKLLDDALSKLEANRASNSEQVKQEFQNRKSVPAASKLTAAQMKQAATALHQEDVAWRKIAWKTCLLEGLKASRDQKKPVLLWVFIDRPIDDERC